MTERCESCEHDRSYHPGNGGCWFAVTAPRPGPIGCACRQWMPPVRELARRERGDT